MAGELGSGTLRPHSLVFGGGWSATRNLPAPAVERSASLYTNAQLITVEVLRTIHAGPRSVYQENEESSTPRTVARMLSSSFKSCIGMPSWTDEFLRQSLLSEDIIDVHFHLFSRRSKSRVLYPRMLNTNTALLKNSAKYFKDVFSSDSAPSHAIIFNVRTTDSIFDGLELDDYGYGSDSISRMRTMAPLS
ncbi:hypothetical protein EDD16DRAFT_1716020 [Pisolithus croceorrhizus]|nr:hypothetical protein EDD16DRAFT_1716020 [Pisolithus croceorrhizus]